MSTALGTWSHAAPQLTLSDVLVARGHKVAFATYGMTLDAWLKNYPQVTPVNMGASPMLSKETMEMTIHMTNAEQHVDMMDMLRFSYSVLADCFKDNFLFYRKHFTENPAQPLPPNYYLIGPQIPPRYPPLSDDLRAFLDARPRTVYVGFGTMAIVSQQRLSTMLQALLVAHRDGLLDGVVWGLMLTAQMDGAKLRSVTVDGVTHSIDDMRSGKHPVIRLMDHAPQRAVLTHPSTKLFISHCGISSIYETIDAGVPVLGVPVAGDQENNARRITELNAGRWIQKLEVNEDTLASAFAELLSPESETLQEIRGNMSSLQRMIHIAHRDRARGADLIELAAVPGAVKFHQSADWRMPWWKAQNYDLYAFVLVFLGGLVYTLVAGTRYAIPLLRAAANQRKEKQA
ncbi:hypothetical protein SYNPS1DRAFT_22842 [Syncephalis pseudoplumigaleata]|uniref:UDP-glycosyltransferases domain-containing protein n=1 Tax=Syncephalis pseudoplumigaleata TaxID=1712513 RepID=A0A4P9Z189_9FUNG|nr:hypothetical protein SYNPS1DRAFT_22842 [Syncephalis pseudoplumigaleata]|eukprot:RKP25150.1 hypothetical protein SYNPS1DRAFT_22842 [Syncephalis pseudoplumigaleata]